MAMSTHMIVDIYCWVVRVWGDGGRWSSGTGTIIEYITFLTKLKLLLLDLNFYTVPSIPKCYNISTLFTLINDTLSEWWILLECNLKDNIILGRMYKKFRWEFRTATRWNPTITPCGEGCGGGIWKRWQ